MKDVWKWERERCKRGRGWGLKEEGSCDRGMEVCEMERGVRTGGQRFERGRERDLREGGGGVRKHWCLETEKPGDTGVDISQKFEIFNDVTSKCVI